MRRDCRVIAAEQLAELERVARKRSLQPPVRRARAVLRFFRGEKYRDLCRQLDIAQPTLARWVKRFRAQGVEGLKDRRAPGRVGRLQSHAQAWLPQVIHVSPRALGQAQDRWTLKALQKLCLQQTGVAISTESLRRALHRLELSWKRAKKTITSPDPEYPQKKGR